jgi:hypothetical protein
MWMGILDAIQNYAVAVSHKKITANISTYESLLAIRSKVACFLYKMLPFEAHFNF